MNKAKLSDSDNNTTSFVSYKNYSRHEYEKSFHYNVSMIKPQEKNQIYQHFVGKKILSQFLLSIFGVKDFRLKTQPFEERLSTIKGRSKTLNSQNSRTDSSLGSKKRSKDKQKATNKVLHFNQSLKGFHKSMIVNKNRIDVLNKYNNAVKKFQNKLPKDPSQQTRQSIEENQKLIQLCLVDKTQQNKRIKSQKKYDQIMRFSEPQVELDLRRQFLKKKKHSTIRQDIKRIREREQNTK